jgi:FAD/FMN-containing dehydrogenase
VDELEVVTGEGHLVRCSLRDNPELFAGAKGGLGQLAVIVRAKLRLREVARQVRGYYLLYDDLERLVRDFELLMVEQRFHYIEAFGVPCHLGFKRAGEAALEFGEWFYPVQLSVEFSGVPPSDEAMLSGLGYRRKSYVEDAVAADFAFRHESLFDLWRRVGSWGQAHPWVETVLPWEKALPYVEGVLRSLPPSLLGGGSVTLRPRRPTQAELPFLRQPEGKYVLDFGILPALSKQSLQMALPLLKKAGELGSDVGGKRLLSGWVDFDDSQWREHFGTFWDGLRERKRFYDPRGILNPSLVQYGDLNA